MLKRAQEVMDCLYAINDSTTKDETISHYKAFISYYGFSCYFITQMVNPATVYARKIMNDTDFPPELVVKRSWPGDLLKDPVVQYCLRSRFPFSWSRAYETASRFGREFAKDSHDFNLYDGYMFPMRRPGSLDGGISIGAEFLELADTAISELQMVSMTCYYHLEALNNGPFVENDVQLAPQEMEVLHFIGAGKTFEDVAIILNISIAGAKAAMIRARDKLNAVNSVQAVTEAIRRDLISL